MGKLDHFDNVVLIHGLLAKGVEDLGKILKESAKYSEDNYPLVDIILRKDKVIVSVELPGVSLEDFRICLYEDLIVIEGRKELKDFSNRVNFLRIERYLSTFRRIVRLPVKVDHEDIKAVLRDGVLEVELNRFKTQYKNIQVIKSE